MIREALVVLVRGFAVAVIGFAMLFTGLVVLIVSANTAFELAKICIKWINL